MSIQIVDSEGNTVIKVDEKDPKKDILIQDGEEVLVSEVQKKLEKEKTEE